MANPLRTGKQSVSLDSSGLGGATRAHGSKGVPGSRIRRDPPPIVKEIAVRDPDKRDARMVIIGVLSFTLALTIIMIGAASYNGWSPRDYVVHL